MSYQMKIENDIIIYTDYKWEKNPLNQKEL